MTDTPKITDTEAEALAVSERPAECCGVCPPIKRGGYDCTCADNPNCDGPRGEGNDCSETGVVTMTDTPKITEAEALIRRLRLYADQVEIADEAESEFSRDMNAAAALLDAVEAQTEPPAVTDEMVEAAARAMFEETYGIGDWGYREVLEERVYRRRARTAVEAALAVSPKKGQDQ